MSTPQGAESPPAATPAPAARSRTPLFAGLAIVVGAAVGWLAIGPRLGGKAAAPAEAGHEAEAEAEGGGGEHGAGRLLVSIDNIIVNPAGSLGSRYLVASVSVEVGDAELETKLHAAEIPIRDAITGVLEKKTLEWLTKTGARDSVRAEIVQVVSTFAGKKPIKVYLPQFLVQ